MRRCLDRYLGRSARIALESRLADNHQSDQGSPTLVSMPGEPLIDLTRFDQNSPTDIIPAISGNTLRWGGGSAEMGERRARLRRASGTQTRVAWLDQARWAAVFLATLWHFAGLLGDRSVIAVAFIDFVNTFVTALLVVLAGWSARSLTASRAALRRIFWQLLCPFVIFQILALSLEYAGTGTSPSLKFTEPALGLWFLVALAAWRILRPWFSEVRFAAGYAAAISLIAGTSSHIGELFALSQIIFFFPLFLLGPAVVTVARRWRQLRWTRLVAGVILCLVALAVWRQDHVERGIFVGNQSYAALDQSLAEGMASRLGAWCLGLVLALCICLLMPTGSNHPSLWWRASARAGERAIYPYLLHLPAIHFLVTGLWAHDNSRGILTELSAVLSLLTGAIVTIVLSTTAVQTMARPLVEPRSLINMMRAAWRQPASG